MLDLFVIAKYTYSIAYAFSSDLDLPKSKRFTSPPTMVGLRVATKPWNFYSPEPSSLLPKTLENSEALEGHC